ncbi:SulP family inorganic anion transporter [Mangrovimonas sp. YM274]|uniref:SulP family inorganic anion transporter n=1 Tax=Mangrovimonas sp. YM274 TaxID=3070660 RepID=UPI0027DBCE3D|nr:SulP family inorganic anion transporter [Mangrovimonas sp. YM274]WMI68977.1 SulP family inorganic anion transporter [Mangrovimonas sp. YM274]
MSPRKNNIKTFFSQLPRNIFSGFVVSLISLPLGLGLAMASEAPPIAGVITAIVSGLVVSILGGSHVTITGPGNGMVGVTLVAITALGLNGAYAAVICSGLVMIALGFFKLGKLSDFFPSSAIQGMLAAIGLIILGKQFHIMLAHKIQRTDAMDYLIEIPVTINDALHYERKGLIFAAIIGVVSLVIMVIYPKLRNKYLQLIPAPMWIVLLSIGFSYYFELVLHEDNPISKSYMVSGIPHFNEIITQIPTVDFSQMGSIPFWSSVLALTLIASIESLLSIKAVDKLDPENRRSNVNKDLKALGVASIGSGFLGGLNVVTVIARSSVNVNNGGSNTSSNFFHAFFLVIFIVLFSTQLTRVPLPALMAILVFTGYKLASPTVIRNIVFIGKEQLIIFFVTLFVTLKIGLITGIISGVITTLIIHIVINKSFMLFVRNLMKPNVLMYKEDNGNYYVSVKHFCSFLNYYKLKEKLDAIPPQYDVVVDFSLCNFVDHTVMENLNGYQDMFTKNDGHFEIVGLDTYKADSEHPLALRRNLSGTRLFGRHLTKRQSQLQTIAEDFSLGYNPTKCKDTLFLKDFLFFKTKQINHIYNRLFNDIHAINLFDIEFSEGEFIAKEVVRTTMLHIDLENEVPVFTLDREGFLEKVYALAGFKDIPIQDHDDFSKRFYLLGEDVEGITSFFNDELVLFFESNPYYHIESNGTSLLIFSKERLASIKELKALLDFGKRLQNTID